MSKDNPELGGVEDEETRRIMKDHDVDEDTAEKVQEIMDEWGVDEDEAVELADEL